MNPRKSIYSHEHFMLAHILSTTGNYSDNDKTLFERAVAVHTVKKDDVILREGTVCFSVFFAIEGAYYEYQWKDEIDLSIVDLHTENEWFCNQQSFVSQKRSETTIQAYSNGEILELSIHAIHSLIAQSPAFLQMGKIISQTNARTLFFDNDLNPMQKYRHILEHRPQLLQSFPLKMIASYLKITPETLSRVREKIARGISDE
jgi:CRP-like cAMP-binding protein